MLNTRKSATRRFFLLFLFYFIWIGFTQASSLDCAIHSYDETATVKYIHDGDTIKLLDGRKIRLIGINTPEVARDIQPAEAYAFQARDRLRSLLQAHNNEIKLVYGREKQDHYQRSLAHIFLADGSNLQAQLISEGLANAITIPPNDRYSNCYQQTEKQALCARKGLWSKKILSASDLEDSASGFRVLSGTLNSIRPSSKGIWLELEHDLSLRINSQHKPLFNMKRLESLLGHTVIVKGWLQPKKDPKHGERFYMQIKHPSSIEEEKKYLEC